jgi:hypothetical protein
LIAETANPAPNDSAEVVELKRQLQWALLKIQVLEERLRLIRIRKYGPGSEKLSDAHLELLELEPGVSQGEVHAEGERASLPVAPQRVKTERPRQHPGRQELPANLPRVERVIACPAEQCQCQSCGQPTLTVKLRPFRGSPTMRSFSMTVPTVALSVLSSGAPPDTSTGSNCAAIRCGRTHPKR